MKILFTIKAYTHFIARFNMAFATGSHQVLLIHINGGEIEDQHLPLVQVQAMIIRLGIN